MLREAALYQYAFLATQVETEAGELRAADPARLQAVLAAAVRHPYDWLCQPLPGGEPALALPAAEERRCLIQVYPPSDAPPAWSFNDRWAARAEIYLCNDTLSLRLAYGCQGQADDETYRRLAEAPWQPPADQFLRGQTLCTAGRVADVAEAEAEAARVLPGDSAHPWPLRRADLPLADGRCAWLFDRPGLPDRLALFYPDDDEAERLVAPYLNTVLPDLLLSLHKIAHQYGRGYEGALRLLLAEKERALAKVLAGEPPSGSDVAGLDARLSELAGAYNDFARELASFDRLAQAVRVNLLNLRECFAEHGLPREGPLAVSLTAAERAVAQLEADDGFYRARVRQAQMALSALQVRAEIERARLEQEEDRRDRQRNLLLGFIAAVLALGQVTSDAVAEDFLKWGVRLFGGVPLDPMPAPLVFVGKLGLVLVTGLLVVGLIAAVGRLRRRA